MGLLAKVFGRKQDAPAELHDLQLHIVRYLSGYISDRDAYVIACDLHESEIAIETALNILTILGYVASISNSSGKYYYHLTKKGRKYISDRNKKFIADWEASHPGETW